MHPVVSESVADTKNISNIGITNKRHSKNKFSNDYIIIVVSTTTIDGEATTAAFIMVGVTLPIPKIN